jgi:hypothetical protein
MTNPKTTEATTEPMREEVMEFVRKSEETIADAGRSFGENLLDLVPGDGESIRKVVDEAFDFMETVLKNQRELAHSVLDRVLGESTAKRRPSKRSPAKSEPAKPIVSRPARRATGRVGAA